MKNECDRIGDAIWEQVRFGTELPDDVRRHIARCPECARVMSESASLSGIMQAAACVPKAPDSTNAVMSRISGLPAKRTAWAYAAGIFAVLVISGFLLLHPHGRSVQIARQVVTPPQATPYQPPVVRSQAVQPAIQPREHGTHHVPVTAVYHRPRVRHRVSPKVMLAHAGSHQQPTPPDRTSDEQPATGRRPIMAVAVTWSADPNSGNSYAYCRTDDATGETTTCRVEKSPGSVNIFMESKPSGEKPPSKGV
jgi:hypothetical protein